MQDQIIEKLHKSQERKRPRFSVGDKVSVHVRLKEGDKERIQIFRGIVISKHHKSGQGPSATFTVRKISEGVGVERIFPIHSPFIEKIDVENSSEVRRSRLYFLRSLKGKKARLKESDRFSEFVVPEAEPAVAEEATAAAAPVEAPEAEKKSDKTEA